MPRQGQPEREVIRVTDDTPRSELEALLAMALEDTARLPRTIEKFSANRDHWSPWSEAHDYLNDLLDDWQRAGGSIRGQGCTQVPAVTDQPHDGQASAPHA